MMRVRHNDTTVVLSKTATSTYDVSTFDGRHLGFVTRVRPQSSRWRASWREDGITRSVEGATRVAAVCALMDAR